MVEEENFELCFDRKPVKVLKDQGDVFIVMSFGSMASVQRPISPTVEQSEKFPRGFGDQVCGRSLDILVFMDSV